VLLDPQLPYVGAKNTSQKAGTGKLSPMVSIGKLGQKVKILGSVKSNVTLSSQGNSYQIYVDQYDSNYYLARPAAFMLRRLIDQAEKDGISFTITSAYRNTTHNKSVGGATDSAHAYGGAIDIGELYHALSPKGSKSLAANAIVRNSNSLYKWLEENGPKYGWFNPYRLRSNSGINEVWHWEFWGVPGENYSLNAFTPDDNGTGDTIFTIPTLEKSPNLSVK
jgi:LAS superfamily LD-carboxypeptidase LdcB